MIENIDENMGRLMNKLDQWNLSKDTILIFMSDNGSVGSMVREGSKLGTSEDGKAMEGYNAGMKGSKGSPHEGGPKSLSQDCVFHCCLDFRGQGRPACVCRHGRRSDGSSSGARGRRPHKASGRRIVRHGESVLEGSGGSPQRAGRVWW